MMKITVVIPTYQRPRDLLHCLEALKCQTRLVDELLIIVRDTDISTWGFIKNYRSESLSLKTLEVNIPGVIAAMNAGLDFASGDIVAFTDDDAVPHQNWLERIEANFLSDESVAGVGGRDWVYIGGQLYDGMPREEVGQVQWFGRVIGNHHLGIGQSREVDILKGVNMSFRRTAIKDLRFDQRMRGTGAQVHFEMMFCLKLKQAGWKLIYDPLVAVDHYPAQRFDEDQRSQFNELAWMNAVHNQTLALLEHLSPLRRAIFIFWATLIGTRQALGLIQWLRLLPQQGSLARRKWQASMRGRWQGWQTWKQTTTKV